jgi:nicotinamide riboside kinase
MISSIYIVGAQCTGKTTLINRLNDYFAKSSPLLKVFVISELARDVLRQHNISGLDVQAGHSSAMHLQRAILETQFEVEKQSQLHDLTLSDRSGLDPIAYSAKYGGSQYVQDLAEMAEWTILRSTMQKSVVILCEPVVEWLTDDGERLMPKSNKEWFDLHETFLRLLEEMAISFSLLPSSITAQDDRIRFVLNIWEGRSERSRI